MVFIKNAGTVILGIVIVMWWLSAYPRAETPDTAIALRADAAAVITTDPALAENLEDQANRLELNAQQSGSFAGQIGSFAEPLFAPLGADRTLTVGILTSFLAREVFVSSLAVLQGGGSDVDDDESVLQLVRDARRPDGSPLFNTATAASMLVFFVLAMQCLPTLAVTRRETGSWKWPALQFAWMTGLAWVLSALVFAVVTASTAT